MATDTFRNPVEFNAAVTFKGAVTIDTTTLKNSQWSTSSTDRLAASKQIHQQHIQAYIVEDTVTVATADHMFWAAPYAGTIIACYVHPLTAPTGGDKQYTIDLQRAADGSASFSTMLSAAEVVDSSSVDGTRQDATLSATALAAGDKLKIVTTASGSTGTQGTGVIVTLIVDMDPA